MNSTKSPLSRWRYSKNTRENGSIQTRLRLCNAADDAQAAIQLPFAKKNSECPLLFCLHSTNPLQFHLFALHFTHTKHIHKLCLAMVFDKHKMNFIVLITIAVFHNSRSRPFRNLFSSIQQNRKRYIEHIAFVHVNYSLLKSRIQQQLNNNNKTNMVKILGFD